MSRGRPNFIEQTNPLRALSPSRVASMLESSLRGDITRLMWVYYLLEQSDPDLVALIERNLSAIAEMDYNVIGARPDAIAFIQKAYNRIGNLQEAITHLALAKFRGFSVCQLQDDDGNPVPPGSATRIACLPHWCFVRKGRALDFKWNPDARPVSYAAMTGDPLDADRDHLIIRVCDRPIDRIALVKYCRSVFAQRAWADYIEKVSDEGVFVIEPPGLDDETKRAEFVRASEDASAGGGGSYPNGTQLQFANANRGLAPFESYMRFLREQLVMAGTGGMLTMIASPTGIGQGASDAHTETFRTIARKDAREISEAFQRGFDAPMIRHLGAPSDAAYFELAYREETDVTKLVEIGVKLGGLFDLDPAEWGQKTQFKLRPKTPPAALPASPRLENARKARPSAPATDDQLALATRELETVAAAFDTDLLPLRERIAALLERASDDLIEALRSLQADLPDLLPDDPAAAAALEQVFTAEFFNGLAQAAAEMGVAS